MEDPGMDGGRILKKNLEEMGVRKPGLSSHVLVHEAVVWACKSPGSMKYKLY
jgi:hypothetical protein